jgi:hypothetical protein
MKKYFTLIPVLILICSFSYAKIWRVNNISGINADFTTIQAAHDGAASGDTIYVEGSPTNYGSLTSSKKLIIIGPGYFLSENPGNQAITLTAQISYITYNVGSEDSIIMGMDFYGEINIYCDNITIKRNDFAIAIGGVYDWGPFAIRLNYHSNNSSIPVSNIYILQNFGTYVYINYASTGVLISNNYITYNSDYGDQTNNAILNLNTNCQAIVQNNIFRRGGIDGNANSSFSNNILVNGFVNLNGALSSNNIASGTQFGTTNGNQANVNMSTVFEASGAWDIYWKLKAGSPAIGAGYGGADAGMFGGTTPYVLSGIPSIPSIYSFINQPIGSNSDPINVTIKVKSNN